MLRNEGREGEEPQINLRLKKECIHLFLAALDLHWCVLAFPSCGEGATLSCVAPASHWWLLLLGSMVPEFRLQ